MECSFAQNEMKKRGWSSGQGLGRNNKGMREAIKVKRKSDTGGLGHSLGDEFSFHWWDHIFNKAASSIRVDEGEGGGVTITTEKLVGPVSFRKPLRRSYQGQELMYGMFVKAGTYQQTLTTDAASTSDDEDPFAFSSDSSDEDEEEDDGVKLNSGLDTFDKVFKTTGMTGHKGARHGQTMSGKLARIMEQESACSTPHESPSSTPLQPPASDDPTKSEKKKKKKKKEKAASVDQFEPQCRDSATENSDSITAPKKKKRMTLPPTVETSAEATAPSAAEAATPPSSHSTNTGENPATVRDVDNGVQPEGLVTVNKKKKKKKRKKRTKETKVDASAPPAVSSTDEHVEEEDSTISHSEQVEDVSVGKKKKKKRKLGQVAALEGECVPAKKKKMKNVACEPEVAIHTTEQNHSTSIARPTSPVKIKKEKNKKKAKTQKSENG